MSREELITHYFEDYSYAEIRETLIDCGKSISYRHVQRINSSLGLSKKNKTENLDQIICCILQELESSGSCLGYKALWLRLKQTYGLEVKRDTVLAVLRIVDPDEMHIDNAFEHFTEKPMYCNPVFVKLVEEILPNVSVLQNVEEATILYHKILADVNKYSD